MQAHFELFHILRSAVLVVLVQYHETELPDELNGGPEGGRGQGLKILETLGEGKQVPELERELGQSLEKQGTGQDEREMLNSVHISDTHSSRSFQFTEAFL